MGEGPEITDPRRASVPSIFTSFLASLVTTHHPNPQPPQCPEHRDEDGVQPERPGETELQEVEIDILPVLHDEDDRRCAADNGCDRAEAGFAIVGTS